MSRWFRHYAGLMRDEKLVRVAVKTKQPVERVVWVWGAILESASEINDGGRYEFDIGEAAYFLRCDESELAGIVGCLEDSGRVSASLVVRWRDRQFDSDSSKERQRRYRERQNAGGRIQQCGVDLQGENVTPPSRDGQVTLQETETETETETEEDVGANAPTSPEPEKSAPAVVVGLPTVSDGDFRIFETDVAEWVPSFPAIDVRQQLLAMRSWLLANPTRRKTKRGMRRFVVAWLDRKQNAAPALVRSTSPPPQREPRNPGERAFLNLQNGFEHDTPGQHTGRMDPGDGRRQVEGPGILLRYAGPTIDLTRTG